MPGTEKKRSGCQGSAVNVLFSQVLAGCEIYDRDAIAVDYSLGTTGKLADTATLDVVQEIGATRSTRLHSGGSTGSWHPSWPCSRARYAGSSRSGGRSRTEDRAVSWYGPAIRR